MHRSLFYGVLAGLLLLAPLSARAANPNWTKVPGTVDCGALNAGSVCAFRWTATADATSTFLQTGGRAFSCRLEPHKEGAATAAQADIYGCTSTDGDGNGTQDNTACMALTWDTDGDGLADDNTFDATNTMKVGTPVFMGLPYVYIDPIADPVAGTAEVVCIGEQDQ